MKMSCAVKGLGAGSMELGLSGIGSEAQYRGQGLEWQRNDMQNGREMICRMVEKLYVECREMICRMAEKLYVEWQRNDMQNGREIICRMTEK